MSRDTGVATDRTTAGEPFAVPVRQPVLGKNQQAAERNRQRFRALGLTVLNLLSAPGSGKTELLRRTLLDLGPRLRAAVVVGDLATDNDAQRLRQANVPVVQLTTGTVCHLDATMVARALDDLELETLDLLIVENVGNLVCPAAYDLGEDLRVVLVAVTEGEDKPLKYPVAFDRADVVLVTKIDLTDAAGCDRDTLLRHLTRAAPRARVFEVSARTGSGMHAWYDALEGWVRRQHDHESGP
jgi:hydrogenase nickel incorporation protein HypB